jgi:diguanylate cyclase (GGDEF)-like protein
MSPNSRGSEPAAGLPPSASGAPGPLRLAMIAAVAAVTVAVAGGGEAFWLCLPAVVLSVAAAPTRLGAAVGTAAVVVASGIPAAVWDPAPPLPSPLLAVIVPAASAIALIAWRERLERERDTLRDFALSDPLTGIANRTLLLGRAEYEVARHRRAERSFTVLMLDLDGFKLLNDRFGHAAGDDLLRDVAAALTRAMRAQDTAARIGGDEFCVLAPETDELGGHRLATRIQQAVGEVTAGIHSIQASVGIAVFPADGVTAPALMHEADHRLLSVKRERRRGRAGSRAA